MFKYRNEVPALREGVAEYIIKELKGEVPPKYLYDESSTHEWWHERMVDGYPDLKTFKVKERALLNNNMFKYVRNEETGLIDTDSPLLINSAFIAIHRKGDHAAWHTDLRHDKSIVVFLSDRTIEDGGSFEYINEWAMDNPTFPTEYDPKTILIPPKFNTWVEFYNPYGKGCFHRVTPNLIDEPRISLTIFFYNPVQQVKATSIVVQAYN